MGLADNPTPYEDIPTDVRDVLDEIYAPSGVEIWWNSRNRVLHNWYPLGDPARDKAPLIPREHPRAALDYAHALAEGAFL